MDTAWIFLNSNIGMLLASTLVAGVALFTWQRLDWRAKQEYKRREVILDRRIELVEAVVKDASAYLAHAANVLAAIEKAAGTPQLNAIIQSYNDQQSKWFAASETHAALAELYLPEKLCSELGIVVEATRHMDVAIYHATQDPAQTQTGYTLQATLREGLQTWSRSAWDLLAGGPHLPRRTGDTAA